MQREEFETRIRELLPGSSEIALATVTTYAEEPDELAIELSDGAGQHGFTAPDADAGVSRPVARAAGTAEWARETLLKRRGG